MFRYLSFAVVTVFAITSCAKLGGGNPKDPKAGVSPFGPTGIPPALRARDSGGGIAVPGGGNQSNRPPVLIPTAEEDIVYTDPDHPEEAVTELSTLLTNQKRGPWEESETIAKQRSVREGKPLLIWFTDSATSPMCKALTQELFSKSEFGIWAMDKLIRLRVDANLKADDHPDMDLASEEDRRARLKNYGAELRKRYQVMGYPCLIMLSPSGEVVGRYRGYTRGDAENLWGRMKHGEAVASEAYKGWRAGLEKKGYREWQDRRGRKIFAKLTSYLKGELHLIEPDGTRSRTREEGLSNADQAWISEQKKLRHME